MRDAVEDLFAMPDSDYTTISLKPGTADRLWNEKNRSESYDDVVNRLIDELHDYRNDDD